MITPALPIPPSLTRRLDGQPLLLLLDIDGTLAPIAPRPEDARIPDDTKLVLAELATLPGTHVVATSGRAACDARRLVGLEQVWIVGNHGVEVAAPGCEIVARPDVAAFVDRIAAAVVDCADIARDTPGLIVEDKRWSFSVHYRLADPRIVTALSVQMASVARAHGLQLTYGRKVFELRAPVDVDKGTAAIELAKRFGALTSAASIVCVGDDRTDEDAFRALRGRHADSVTVRVGEYAHGEQQETAAEFSLADSDRVREFLEVILARRTASVGH
jgi:trehalose-phosphatase